MCDCFSESSKNLLSKLRSEHSLKNEHVLYSSIKPKIGNIFDDNASMKFGSYYEYEYRSNKKENAKLKKVKGTIGYNYCPICGEKY